MLTRLEDVTTSVWTVSIYPPPVWASWLDDSPTNEHWACVIDVSVGSWQDSIRQSVSDTAQWSGCGQQYGHFTSPQLTSLESVSSYSSPLVIWYQHWTHLVLPTTQISFTIIPKLSKYWIRRLQLKQTDIFNHTLKSSQIIYSDNILVLQLLVVTVIFQH